MKTTRIVGWMLVLAIHLHALNAWAQTVPYEMGTLQAVQDIYVSPSGNDAASGTLAQPLRTLAAAWDRIPSNTPLNNSYRILLLSGTYPESSLPNYMENKRGSYANPVIIQAAQGRGTATLQGDLNVYNCSYLYLLDLQIVPNPPGDVLHFEKVEHALIRNSVLKSAEDGSRSAHETIKANQSQYLYLEDNDISGAYENAVDFVAVQYGHIWRNHIHNADDWCMYLKGGSAQFVIEANEVYDCGTGGITAGQGTGMEYMTAPWLHYEAYDLKLINNIIHHTEGAALGVNGGYNILIAHNTAYRIGARSHVLEVVYGGRSCDGNTAQCEAYRSAGGWGYHNEFNFIPNRNVFIYNNIFYNPSGYQSQWQHMTVQGPIQPPAASNLPGLVYADQNLQIKGNLFWNGSADHPLGIGGNEGCAETNPTCNETQLRADNAFNQIEPELAAPENRDFHPVTTGNLISFATKLIPAFDGGDAPSPPEVPTGDLSNGVWGDFGGNGRMHLSTVGAYGYHPTTDIEPTELPESNQLGTPFPNPFSGTAQVEVFLTQAQSVQLTVVDVLGRTHIRLHEGTLAVGRHLFGLSGNTLRSGLYFVRLETRQGTVVRRMLVVK